MKRTLTPEVTKDVAARLARANEEAARHFPGDSAARQPVHTVYGGAHLFRSDSAPKLGGAALAALDAYAPDARAFALALGLEPSALMEEIYERMLRKLRDEPVEDIRIDFEDGYGMRPDTEEDAHAVAAAREVSSAHAAHSLPPYYGIRIKPLVGELAGRALRTLDLFLSTIAAEGGGLPANFVVTLPKVTRLEHVSALTDLLDLLEPRLGLAPGRLRFELMVETPQTIFGEDGRVVLPSFVRAGRGRCVSAHFGTYDYTAGLNITAAHQHMAHPACDFARHVMQVSLAGTGIMLSDGATNVLPVGDRAAVHTAWRLHYADVRRSLEGGFYQGWDLHPAQLATRFAANFGFFLEGKRAAQERLRAALEKGAGATSGVLDDPATGQALLAFFLRGKNCGAFREEDVARAGLSAEDLVTGSFSAILATRRAG
jgi:citrate lyase beta subunit